MDGPNPLRPYYIPPSVGSVPDYSHNLSGGSHIGSRNAAAPSFGSSARNILADMDYTEYLSESSPSPADFIKRLLEQVVWKYSSIFLAQPFEVAKTALQVQLSNTEPKALLPAGFAEDSRRRPPSLRSDSYETPSDDSDPDSPSYFTTAAPSSNTHVRATRGRRRRDSLESPSRSYLHTNRSHPPKPLKPPHTLDLKSSSSLLAVLSSIWRIEGSWGLWKGTNSTYVYSILSSTITSFVRSFLSAVLALPDPGLSIQLCSAVTYTGGLDVLSSPSPLSSLAVAVSAAAISAIVLAPLDIARTMLIVTPSNHPPRTILSTLNTLSSWKMPLSIAPVTIFHATIPTFLSASTPLLLRSKLGVDPLLTPNFFAVMTFAGQGLELLLKLPVETILRRGQIEVARRSGLSKDVQTIVDIGPYKGFFGTVHSIVYEEGVREAPAGPERGIAQAKNSKSAKVVPQRQRIKGQGYEGLWRGWRVGMWGLLGVWGAATLGGVGGKGGEF